MISLAYEFLGTRAANDKEGVKATEREAEAADSESKAIYAFAGERKGAQDRLCRKAVHALDDLGYKELVVKGDQEPALVAFTELLKNTDLNIIWQFIRISLCLCGIRRQILQQTRELCCKCTGEFKRLQLGISERCFCVNLRKTKNKTLNYVPIYLVS